MNDVDELTVALSAERWRADENMRRLREATSEIDRLRALLTAPPDKEELLAFREACPGIPHRQVAAGIGAFQAVRARKIEADTDE